MAKLVNIRLKRAGLIIAIVTITLLSSCASEFCHAYARGTDRMQHGKQKYAANRRSHVPMPGSVASLRP